MTGQPALIRNPGGGFHLWRRFIDDDAINHAQWLRACAEGAFVGECSCGSYLTPRRPEHVGGRTDYSAECSDATCGKEIAAPGGRLRPRAQPHRGGVGRG